MLDDGIILRSEANLVASLRADWSLAHKKTARAILARIAAEEQARTSREIRAIFPNGAPAFDREAAARFDARLLGREDGRLLLHCAKRRVPELADWLIGQGAANVAVAQLDYVFEAQNALYDKLAERIG